MANANLDKIVDELSNLSLMEAATLVTILKEKWGVSDAPVMAALPSANVAAEPTASKTEFDVILLSGGDEKLKVIKVVREIRPDLNLKDAKDLVESAPKSVTTQGVAKDEANKIKEKLEAAGAKVELK